MDLLEFHPSATVKSFEDDADFLAFLASESSGLAFVPEPQSHCGVLGLKSDFSDFAKWARATSPNIQVTAPNNVPKIILRNSDVWLPLAFLAGDTSIQIFLNMVASYLYDRAKGSLKNERTRIHLSVVYQDKAAGKSKRFDFSGDSEALGKAIKRFDLNEFFDDESKL
ncbi:MAG: hypothetical protein ABII81_09405 [Pseudomonadota bacterium]